MRVDVSAAPTELTFDAVSRGDVVATVEATGTLQPLDTVQVGTQVSGTIASIGTDFNQVVKRGQVLATLDPAISLTQNCSGIPGRRTDRGRLSPRRIRVATRSALVGVVFGYVPVRRAAALMPTEALRYA